MNELVDLDFLIIQRSTEQYDRNFMTSLYSISLLDNVAFTIAITLFIEIEKQTNFPTQILRCLRTKYFWCPSVCIRPYVVLRRIERHFPISIEGLGLINGLSSYPCVVIIK